MKISHLKPLFITIKNNEGHVETRSRFYNHGRHRNTEKNCAHKLVLLRAAKRIASIAITLQLKEKSLIFLVTKFYDLEAKLGK
jgi:hypothetical protein